MEILLMRHGTASWDAARDAQRPLTERGQQEVTAARDWLKNAGWHADQLWHSPFLRARQTAEIINRHWQLATSESAVLTPDASIIAVESFLTRLLSAELSEFRLMLIGHNPLFSALFNHWCGDVFSGWSLQPASLALFRIEVVAPACGEPLALRHYPCYSNNAL